MSGLEIAAIALAGIGTATSVIGTIQQGNAARASANYQASLDERNATLAEQDRVQAIRTADLAASDKRRENRRQLSSMRAAFGSSGFELAGSPLEVLSDSAQEMALDERRISYEGEVSGRKKAMEVLGLRESAQASRAYGTNAKNASTIAALSEGAKGASRAGSSVAKL
jgi:hypothetical protein